MSIVAPTPVLVTTDEATPARTTVKPGQGEELVRPLSSNCRGPYDLSNRGRRWEEMDKQGPGHRGTSMEAELEGIEPTPAGGWVDWN